MPHLPHELLVSPSSRLLSSAVLRLDQQDASGAGKAPAMQFLSLLKAKPPEYRALLKEASPWSLCVSLGFQANAKVVDAPLVRLASRRLSALSDQFYPPEIMELLEVFAAFPFSDEPLLAAVASRLDDLLTDPSPKRLASLLSIYARLGFCHPVVQDPLMKCIEEKMHTFDAGLLPGLCRSATSLLSPRVPILDGLATQTQLVLSAGLLCEKKSAGSPGVDAEQRRHIGALFSCLESLSRQRYSHAALIDDCLACIDLHIKAFSLQDTLRAIGAARRLGLAGVEEQLRRHMEMQAEGAMDRGDQLLAMLRLLDALRLRDSQLLQKASDAVELHSQKKAFMATQLPEALLHLSRLSPADLQLPVAILSQPALLGMAPRLSASQLQQLLSASALLLFQHIQRRKNKTGAQLGQALSARDVRALAKAVERFLALLQFQYRSLNLRERRAVKEAAALFLLELDGAEGEAASSGFAFSQTETVRFCRSVEDDDVAPTMPLVPSATVDFRSVDLVEVRSVACARLVLCDDGALHAAQAPSASKSEEGKKSRRGKSAEDQERSHPREAQTGKRALLFVAPRDTFADGLGHIPARQAELESKHGEAHEQTVTCELGGMLTDLPAAITPQAASSLLLTQLALQRQGLVRQDIRNCIPPPLKVD
ncbi:conserved hypothetical protein [Neospora caninum Liverpool]|uniref:Uncharacterized protein n=1 Tax=Neospora caninum (strain Liverpool) TaxID=572307 RepID=F0VJV0_NEOCL|nr:conserved hypothetical protein [Neospora caninum Liverpool]CBZ54011.1 conserved hypothetical protein [Neospora caninum Liverpool]|eukprot:XP_003884043.1 conserved hypothetical protein [Neospora caninum Liverpool]